MKQTKLSIVGRQLLPPDHPRVPVPDPIVDCPDGFSLELRRLPLCHVKKHMLDDIWCGMGAVNGR